MQVNAPARPADNAAHVVNHLLRKPMSTIPLAHDTLYPFVARGSGKRLRHAAIFGVAAAASTL